MKTKSLPFRKNPLPENQSHGVCLGNKAKKKKRFTAKGGGEGMQNNEKAITLPFKKSIDNAFYKATDTMNEVIQKQMPTRGHTVNKN